MSGAPGAAFAFGDSPAMADELLALVLAGTKTATCGALRDFGPHEPVPEPGRRDRVLDGQGRPAAVIETVEVRIGRIDSVTLDFALTAGEGGSSVEEWLASYAGYFERNGGYDPAMEVVFERFRLIEALPRG